MKPFEAVRLDEPRLATRRQVRRAAHALAGPGRIHEARVALKRARALVLLCPGSQDGTGPTELRRALGAAARRLAAQRDREAALEIIATVDDRAGVLEEVLEELAPPPENHVRLRRLLDDVAGDLRSLAKEAGRMADDPSGEAALVALGRSYRRARRTWRRARAHPDAETLHALRKRTKTLRYQLEWFAPVWPGVLGAWVADLHTMSDELGQVHDVTVLRRSLAEPAAVDVRDRVASALRALRDDARNCRRWSLARGSRLFAEKPAAFRRRMARIAASVPAPTFIEPAEG